MNLAQHVEQMLCYSNILFAILLAVEHNVWKIEFYNIKYCFPLEHEFDSIGHSFQMPSRFSMAGRKSISLHVKLNFMRKEFALGGIQKVNSVKWKNDSIS